MALFKKESLEQLRERVDLVEVLSSHLDMKRTGAAYKALCPFHDEKTPSFTVQKGDTHYHCFGCGAHGDAIAFLMSHLKLSFSDAVESLADRFHVPLEVVEGGLEQQGPNKKHLKEMLQAATRFFHYCLLHTSEGHEALHYLYSRGLSLEFVRQFEVGYAPKTRDCLRRYLASKGFTDSLGVEAGLYSVGKDGRTREFFQERIPFPIRDATGAVIGFSARKFREETFGGKYINTPETALFKKSRILFGLNYSRKTIAKERKALIVEGQVDALRLIHAGFDFTVAGQGTAFGEGHVKELLQLGVNQAILALDSDLAGNEAAVKIGDLFQKEGVEVKIISFPPGQDPDSYLRTHGPEGIAALIKQAEDYLSFLVAHHAKTLNLNSPAGKNELVKIVAAQIRLWKQPLMVHETLRKLAALVQVPEDVVGVGQQPSPNIYIKKSASVGLQEIDPDRILECDFLRWLLLEGESCEAFIALARQHVTPEDLRVHVCRHLYLTYLECVDTGASRDLLALAVKIDSAEAQLVLAEIVQKRVNREKAEEQFHATIKRVLERNWMQRREELRMRIQSGQHSDEEALLLAKQFEELRRNAPQI